MEVKSSGQPSNLRRRGRCERRRLRRLHHCDELRREGASLEAQRCLSQAAPFLLTSIARALTFSEPVHVARSFPRGKIQGIRPDPRRDGKPPVVAML
jgi:hypothetical protein